PDQPRGKFVCMYLGSTNRRQEPRGDQQHTQWARPDYRLCNIADTTKAIKHTYRPTNRTAEPQNREPQNREPEQRTKGATSTLDELRTTDYGLRAVHDHIIPVEAAGIGDELQRMSAGAQLDGRSGQVSPGLPAPGLRHSERPTRVDSIDFD